MIDKLMEKLQDPSVEPRRKEKCISVLNYNILNYLLMMRNHTAHSFSNGGLSLQSLQIVLYPKQVRTEDNSQGRVCHLSVCHILSHLVQKGTKILEKIEVDSRESFAVTPDLVY